MREQFRFLHDLKEVGKAGLQMSCEANAAKYGGKCGGDGKTVQEYGNESKKKPKPYVPPPTPKPTSAPSFIEKYKKYEIIGGILSYIMSSCGLICFVLMMMIIMHKKSKKPVK